VIVTTGLSAPRTWSVSFSGGKREGASGPGVGTVLSVMQAGGVAMKTPGIADAVVIGEDGGDAQEVRKTNSKK
jgi:hypothetical protein